MDFLVIVGKALASVVVFLFLVFLLVLIAGGGE